MAARSRASPAELAVMAVRAAIREGASEAEAFAMTVKGYKAGIRSNRLESLEVVDDAGVGVRVAVGRRLGFSFATGLDPQRVREAAREAVRAARAAPEDPHWRGLPQPSPAYPEPRCMYSASLAAVEPETLVEDAKTLLESLTREEGVLVTGGGVGVQVVEKAIANSNGVYVVETGTHAYADADALISRGGVTTPAVFEIETSRVSVPDVEALAERLLEKLRLCTRTARLETGRYEVVLAPEPFYELLSATVLYSLRGDTMVEGRSYYGPRRGEEALSPLLTIIDDATLKGGDSTWRSDDEGVAARRKVLVEKGVVKGFIFDTYWGLRAGEDSTGNAVRSGYASRPFPGYTNVVVEPGDASQEELLEGRVLVVYGVQGAHTANRDTGDYSVLANPAVLYERGEPVGWVPGVVVSGNFYKEAREKLSMLGRVQEKPHPGALLPWARLSGISVASKG